MVGREPSPADLEAAVFRRDIQIAGTADESTILRDSDGKGQLLRGSLQPAGFRKPWFQAVCVGQIGRYVLPYIGAPGRLAKAPQMTPAQVTTGPLNVVARMFIAAPSAIDSSSLQFDEI